MCLSSPARTPKLQLTDEQPWVGESSVQSLSHVRLFVTP